MIDLDASIVVCHSEKEQAAPTFKNTFGYHPMLAFCDNTGEFLAATLRRGNAGREHRRRPHHRARRRPGPDPRRAPPRHPDPGPGRHRRLHPGVPRPPPRAARHGGELRVLGRLGDHRDKERAAITAIPNPVWADAIDADGGHRDGAGLAEITGVLPARGLAGYPAGTRVDRPPRAPAPRRAARRVRRTRRLALHRLRHRHPRRAARARSTPDTARTPGSRTASAARRTPASTTSRPGRSRSTPPG